MKYLTKQNLRKELGVIYDIAKYELKNPIAHFAGIMFIPPLIESCLRGGYFSLYTVASSVVAGNVYLFVRSLRNK